MFPFDDVIMIWLNDFISNLYIPWVYVLMLTEKAYNWCKQFNKYRWYEAGIF